MEDIMYAFDLDGTVTREETLPKIARALGLEDEMRLLTQLTLKGEIAFEQSFKLRFHILNGIELERIQEIMRDVVIDEQIGSFIKNNKDRCAIVTGNLDYWIKPLGEILGCEIYSSQGEVLFDNRLRLKKILRKSEAIRFMREKSKRIVAVGDSFNDIPMFEEADIAIAYGGVHAPVDSAIVNSDYVVYDGGSLCRLLKML